MDDRIIRRYSNGDVRTEKICECGNTFSSLKWVKTLGVCPACVKKHLNKKANERDWKKEKNPAWKGGTTRHARGYVLIHMPEHPRSHNGYVFEHIVVAEKKLGRPLLDNESVHHQNMVPWDNRPENILIMTRSEHNKLHLWYRRLCKDSYPKPVKTRKMRIRNKIISIPIAPRKKIAWPEDARLLEMSQRMSTREISREIGNVSNVAVWKRIKSIPGKGQ